MPSVLRYKGFTALEILVVLSIIAIILTVALPNIYRYYTAYKFNQYAYGLEMFVRNARNMALERSINVGICVDGMAVKIVNMGASRRGVCTGSVIKSFNISDTFISLVGAGGFGERGVAFDARGLAIVGGYICITDGNRFHKLCIQRNRGSLKIEEGSGGCGPC